MARKLLVALFISLSVIGTAFSEDIFTAYRDASGDFSDLSVENLNKMRNKAKAEGAILVWVSFGIPFQGDPGLRTPEVEASEAAALQAEYIAVVAPIVFSGDATVLERPQPTVPAPGYLLEVNHKGIISLSKHPHVKHIGYLPK